MAKGFIDYSYTARIEHQKNILFIIFLFILIFSIYNLITSFLVKTYRVNSDAMYPEISQHDFVLVTPMYNVSNSAKRGDVVVMMPVFDEKLSVFKRLADRAISFFTLQMFRPFENSAKKIGSTAIRRVVGFPGDTIYMENFILHIKTKDAQYFLTEFELAEVDYNLDIKKLPDGWSSQFPFSGMYPQITLKENEYFVLCDNRIIADDSRVWGAIDGKTRVYGSVLVKYWPFKSFKLYK